jgi:hypothetical protein
VQLFVKRGDAVVVVQQQALSKPNDQAQGKRFMIHKAISIVAETAAA